MFKIGDVVELKSGGPSMTVSTTDGSDVWCVWFASNDYTKPSTHKFPTGALKAVER